MSFDVAAAAYDQFMGRYSRLLSPQLADLAGVRPGQRVVDVGCGPGALTAELVGRVGPDSVSAVDPSEPFVKAVRARQPGVDVHQASAEALPFADRTFDAALAQLVVHFMSDPVAGLREMARVTRFGGGRGGVRLGPRRRPGPAQPVLGRGARARSGSRHRIAPPRDAGVGHLAELSRAAGLREVTDTMISAVREHPTFEDWWAPYPMGVGPAGLYAAGLDPDRQAELRERCRSMLPEPPFTLTSRAWAARGLV